MTFFNKKIIFLIIFFIVSLIFTFLLLGAENFSLKGYLYSKNYDLISDQLAFKFFINDKWHFPIGKNPNLSKFLIKREEFKSKSCLFKTP